MPFWFWFLKCNNPHVEVPIGLTVSLSATGFSCPQPTDKILDLSIPLAARASITDFARSVESFLLLAAYPIY
jgi:hypothetical protein